MTTTAPSTALTDSTGVTVGELAAALGMSRSSILRAVESGRFPPPMDERRHGWRVWHPIVALALEVGHALGEPLEKSMMLENDCTIGDIRAALRLLHGSRVAKLPAALRRRVDVLRAVVPS